MTLEFVVWALFSGVRSTVVDCMALTVYYEERSLC